MRNISVWVRKVSAECQVNSTKDFYNKNVRCIKILAFYWFFLPSVGQYCCRNSNNSIGLHYKAELLKITVCVLEMPKLRAVLIMSPNFYMINRHFKRIAKTNLLKLGSFEGSKLLPIIGACTDPPITRPLIEATCIRGRLLIEDLR